MIISEQDWERAQLIREARKNRIQASKDKSFQAFEEQYNTPFSTSGKLALIGFTYCGYCGKRLKNSGYLNRWETKEGEKKVSYAGRYSCPSKCKERGSYTQDYLEPIVFSIVEEYMENLKAVDISEEIKTMQRQLTAGTDKQLKNIEKEIQKLREDIATLEDKIPEAIRGDYYFSVEKLSAMIQEKEQKIVKLTEQEKQIHQKVAQNQFASNDLEKFISIIPNWKEEFQDADIATKKMLLSSLIDRIEVKDMDIRIKFKIRLEDFLDFTSEDVLPKTMHNDVQG